MQHLNVEIKARVAGLGAARAVLAQLGATGPTLDHQVDTYFRVSTGRLKLREGTVEQALIHYRRADRAGPKRSDVTLYPTTGDPTGLKEALARALGIDTIVEKRREIWWLGNVKLHLDEVAGLGTFVEIEAIARPGHSEDRLREQCDELMQALSIESRHLVDVSYSDLLAATSDPQTR